MPLRGRGLCGGEGEDDDDGSGGDMSSACTWRRQQGHVLQVRQERRVGLAPASQPTCKLRTCTRQAQCFKRDLQPRVARAADKKGSRAGALSGECKHKWRGCQDVKVARHGSAATALLLIGFPSFCLHVGRETAVHRVAL